MDHSLTLAIALLWAIIVFIWAGDLQSAEAHIEQLIALSEPHSLAPYVFVGRGFKGVLAIRRGDAVSGVRPYRTLCKTFTSCLTNSSRLS